MADLIVTLSPETAAELTRLAQESGTSVEALAAEAIEIIYIDGPPHLSPSPEAFEAGIAAQRRELTEGTAALFEHDDVLAQAREVLAAAKKPPEGR